MIGTGSAVRTDLRGRRWRLAALAAAAALVAVALVPQAADAQDADDRSPFEPVDPQNWVDQEDLTWDAYVPVRPDEWNSDATSAGSEDQYNTAIVLLDFTDQPFLISTEAGSHPFGNPQPGWTPVDDDEVNEWMHEYYAVPNEYNGGQTLHGYWMEDSHGRIGVTVDTWGPFHLDGKLHEYGISTFNTPIDEFCPQGDTCNRNIRSDGNALFRAAAEAAGRECPGTFSSLCGYDNLFYVTAGHDESSTWQEFGEMLFENPEDVPPEFGPPGATEGPVLNNDGEEMPNYADTRYVEWTSWRASANHWPNAGGGTSTQAESSGQSVFAHEFSHLRGLPDNYNNPFADNVRNYTGYWEMMSRGTFNGPGGTHNRWQIPNAGGSGLGPHHMLHFKNQLGVLEDDEQVTLERDELSDQGVAVIPVKARSSVPDGDYVGVTVEWDTSLTPSCEDRGIDDFYCVTSNWTTYRLEVLDRVGNDSFAPGHGVVLSQTRPFGSPRVWMIDPKPEDINMVDFYRPDGTPVMVVRGDPRQLNDATFHAGTDSGSEFEYVDPYNALHFYVLDTYRDEEGALMYDLGVRRLTGAGDFERGVELGDASRTGLTPYHASFELPLTNTGEAGEDLFDSDIYRISSEIEGDGWSTWQPHEVVAAAAGETVPVEVYTERSGRDPSDSALLTVTATSESDPTKSFTIEVEVESPAAAVDTLADAVDDADLPSSQQRLADFVDRIGQEVDDESWTAACHAVNRFEGQVERYTQARQNPLPAELAAEFLALADNVRTAIGCGVHRS